MQVILSIHLTEMYCRISSKYVLHSLHYLLTLTIILLHRWGCFGDPLIMPFYALAIIPLIQGMVKLAWYADDANSCGEFHDLRIWWDQLSQLGHYPNAKIYG